MRKFVILFVLLFVANIVGAQVSHSFTFNTVDFTISVDKEDYAHIQSQNLDGFLSQEGAPELPVMIKKFVLPMGSTVTGINFTNTGEVLLDGNTYIYPAQPDVGFDSIPEFVPPNPAVYNSNNPFPAETSILRSDSFTFGYHVVTVEICPFKYIPKRKKLYLYQNIDISIQYTLGNVEQTQKITRYRADLSQEVVAASVANPELLKFATPTAATVLDAVNQTDKLLMHWLPMGNVPDYLIITNEELKPVFQELADYKIKRGIPTLVVTVEDIYNRYPGVDKAEKIRNYLKDAHRNWGNGLFVLLGGDTDIIPGRIASYGKKSPSDLYYCDVYKPNSPDYNWNQNGNARFGESNDGLELGGDNFIGRAPVKNSTEANTFLEKVIKYEKLDGVSQKSYVNNMLLIGAYYSYNSGSQTGVPGGQLWQYKLDNEDYLSAPQFKKHRLYDDREGVIAYIDNQHVNITGDEELTDTHLLNRLSNGEESIGQFHLVSYYDHGSPFGMGSSNRMKSLGVYREDMDNLTNGDYLQIMYATACDSGKFTLDAWAEHYMNNPNGGGVAIIANSETVSAAEDGVEQTKILFKSIYGSIEEHPNSYLMGVAFAHARDVLSVAQRRKVLTLFGDPTLATWSAVPGDISLSVPLSFSIDNAIDNILTVNINALTEDALITLYKYNDTMGYPEVFAKQTILKGNTNTVFILHPDTPGELLVTATAKNYLPTEATVNILMPQSHLYVTGYTAQDGNNNGVMEPGELVRLSIELTNSGGTAINLIQATLSSHPGLITVHNGTRSHAGTINPGQTVTLSGFVFTLGTSFEGGELPDFIEFFVDISGNGHYEHQDNFYIEQKSPDLNLGTRTVTDDEGQPVSGSFIIGDSYELDIRIHNIGNNATGELEAVLTSPATEIVITTHESVYVNIASHSEESNLTPFVFKLNSASSGLPFVLTLTNEFGQEWVFNFDLNEACPATITGFNFVPGPDRIDLLWNPVPGISGYNLYRSDTEDGIYEKVNTFPVVGTSAYTDYQLTVGSSYYYKISGISLTGQECPLDGLTAYLAWTSKENTNGFPVSNSSIRAAYGSPIIFDVNKNGKKEIFLNYRAGNHDKGIIMGLQHDGQELFDIDNDPETVSGFALTDIALLANSAIGDIDLDGFAEVVSIGRNDDLNQGRLYVYKTIDGNGDGKPDPFWQTEYIDIGHITMRNPVLYDLDNDGYLEIIVADESQGIHVFDRNGNIMPGWPKQISDTNWAEGELAVADLNQDGYGEIIFGVKNTEENDEGGGIYIFNHDGTHFTTNPFKSFSVGERGDGGITIADINKDGNLDILLITKKNTNGRIYAIDKDGNDSFSDGWDDSYLPIILSNSSSDKHIIPRISVGDLDGDGNLEIVFGSKNNLYVLDKGGNVLEDFPIEVGNIMDTTPILADIDGDSTIEIVVNVTVGYDNFIKVFKFDGSICEGWTIQSEYGNPFIGSPAIGDIDGDGLNEVIISSLDGTVYAWNTTGSAERIEWGMHRADSYNTGTYKHGCTKEVDLYIQDGSTDLGLEPNTFTEHMWNSTGIWIRNDDDNGLDHQNPVYRSNNEPNYIMVKVINKGCKASSGTETLTVNWAKANTNLAYPQNWDGTLLNDMGFEMGDQVNGTPITLPVIQAGEEAIISIPWVVPNPENYMSGSGSANPWHFCLLATVLGTTDPLTHPYTENPNSMVKENNNQAWKNLTIIDLTPSQPISGTVAVSNHTTTPTSYDLVFTVDEKEKNWSILKEAEVSFTMDSILYNAWVLGGEQLSENIDVQHHSLNSLPTFYIEGDSAIVKNIVLSGNEIGLISLKFNMLTKKTSPIERFTYHLVQMDAVTDEKIGGESYEIRKPPRPLFFAEADDIAADRNTLVTLIAEDINEAAIYNWYDSEGGLIYTGTELTVIADIAKTYKLEITADADGYKDYTDVNVELNPHELKAVVPNPAYSAVTVSYNLNAPDSAYLSILGYIGNDTGVERNYILNTESLNHVIDLSDYAIGFYTVKLICDGQLVGTLNLIKQ